MKQFSDHPAIAAAFSKIASKSTIRYDNGTYGKTYKAYYYGTDEIYPKEYDQLIAQIASKKYDSKDYGADFGKLKELPEPKIMIIVKLVEPIPVQGTKIFTWKDRHLSAKMETCDELWIPQDIYQRKDIVGWKSLPGKKKYEVDMQGNDSEIFELHLAQTMIDVKEGWKNPDKSWKRTPRAYVTDIPFRALQVVSSLLRREDYKRFMAYNVMSEEEIAAIES